MAISSTIYMWMGILIPFITIGVCLWILLRNKVDYSSKGNLSYLKKSTFFFHRLVISRDKHRRQTPSL